MTGVDHISVKALVPVRVNVSVANVKGTAVPGRSQNVVKTVKGVL